MRSISHIDSIPEAAVYFWEKQEKIAASKPFNFILL